MPRKPRRLDSFPSSFLDILDKAMRGEHIVAIWQPTKKMAKAIQLDINRFRGALLAHGHPGYDAMRDIVISLTKYSSENDEYLVEFTPKKMYDLSQLLKGEEPIKLDGDGLPNLRPKPLDASQEEIFKRLYGWDKGLPGDKKLPEQKIDPYDKLLDKGTAETPPEGTDAAEQARAPLPSCPPHEPDMYGVRCEKCNKPKEQW